jgi:uncharacterized protein YdeI (YjbR/CyaY-like superfamily)
VESAGRTFVSQVRNSWEVAGRTRDEPRTRARDANAWRKWLERNHASAREVWLVFSRKHTGRACVSYDEAVQEAICFGWIDGIKKRIDEDHYAYRFSPRRPGSRWSLINRKRTEALLAAGRMTAAGLAAVEEARRGGTWAAAKVKRPDHLSDLLRAALAGNRRASAAWDALSPSQQRLFNLWVNEAAREETRRRRAQQVLERVLAGRRPGM